MQYNLNEYRDFFKGSNNLCVYPNGGRFLICFYFAEFVAFLVDKKENLISFNNYAEAQEFVNAENNYSDF